MIEEANDTDHIIRGKYMRELIYFRYIADRHQRKKVELRIPSFKINVMKKLKSLNDLLFEQTIMLHSNIRTVIDDLHYLIERSHDSTLKSLLKNHFDHLRIQELRVKNVFNYFESNYRTESYEIKEMLKSIFCRIGRTSDSYLIDSIIALGMKQVSGYMTLSMATAKDLANTLEHKHLQEYIEECMNEESKFLEKLESYEKELIA